MDCSPLGSSVYGIFLGKNTGVGCHFLFQRIFLTQGSNLGLLYCRQSEPPGKNTSEGETNIWTRKNSVNETFKGEKLSSNKGEETDILTHEGTNPLGFEGTGGLQNTETVEMNIFN